MKEHKSLPESELDIMLAVWHSREPVAASRIMKAMKRPLTPGALHSYLKRLEEKGFLRHEKDGRSNGYAALVCEEEYCRAEGEAVLDKLYGGSLKTFAAALWDGGALSIGEVEELRDYLDGLEWRRR